jgi:hypothetical protein
MLWSPWISLPGTATFASQHHRMSISISPLGDGAILQGEVSYYAPGGKRTTQTFFDQITITRDAGSLDEVRVRCKNTGILGTGAEIFY